MLKLIGEKIHTLRLALARRELRRAQAGRRRELKRLAKGVLAYQEIVGPSGLPKGEAFQMRCELRGMRDNFTWYESRIKEARWRIFRLTGELPEDGL